MKTIRIVLLACICLAVAAVSAPAKEFWAHDGWTQVGNWTLGGDIRVRALQSRNMGNMGYEKAVGGFWNDADLWRHRGRLWVTAHLGKGVTTYFRITAEPRWGEDSAASLAAGTPLGREDRWAMFLDNAWIEISRPWDVPLSFKIGRMDQVYGQGFLMIDSDSLYAGDGSRSFFFEMAKATVHLDSVETNIDFLFAKVHEERFNDPGDDEDLYGMYATSLYGKPLKSEFYLLVRNQRDDRIEDIANLSPAAPFGIVHPDRKVYTYGARLSMKKGGFSGAMEFAGQCGTIYNVENFTITNSNGTQRYKPGRIGDLSIRAFAGYIHGGYAFNDVPLKPSLRLGYWFYSGDDMNSNSWGGFDELYAQAPLHGEYYLYSHLDVLSSADTDWDPFMHSNLHFPKFKVAIVPYENFNFSVTYMAMFAHKNTLPQSFTRSEGGLFRGHNIITVLEYKFSENLSAHIWWEFFLPGDYYRPEVEQGHFGRFQIWAKF